MESVCDPLYTASCLGHKEPRLGGGSHKGGRGANFCPCHTGSVCPGQMASPEGREEAHVFTGAGERAGRPVHLGG